ncbi:hypothetical protein ACWEP1_36530, partial [Streptomyces sp. NPDC004285]
MSQAPGGDDVAHENRDGDDVPETHATETAGETAGATEPLVTPEVTPGAAPGVTPEAASAVGAAPEEPDAPDERDERDERDELSGQRMVKIEPGPGEGGDELALRRLFQDAVGDLEPSLGSLEHLRRAVPARRARKRQAIVGAAAAAVLIGTAVPAFVHVAASGGL